MRKLLYLHGFASSGSSGTVRLLRNAFYAKRDLLGNVEVIAPDIPVDPAVALPFLKSLAAKEKPDLIIGTSMGGAYAQQLSGFKRICVNPSFELSKKHSILYVGKHKWMSIRKDDETEFYVSKQTIGNFAAMEKTQFEHSDAADKLCFAMFGTNDTTVDWMKMKRMFDAIYGSQQSMTFEGGHRMNDEVVKHFVLPMVEKLMREVRMDQESFEIGTFAHLDDQHEANVPQIILKNVLGENEKFQESDVIYGNQMIYVRNKKTGRGTFMQYD